MRVFVAAAVVLVALPAHADEPSAEVRVRGQESESDQLRHSADAVTVVDTTRAKQETADLGEVLARTQGVTVRRDGGLGSGARFSLNGLQDDQIRFFLDGVPLDRAGFPFGIANVPANLVDRIEVYRGVVPIRLGSDALGGAVNLVSDPSYTPHLAGSYEVGSFGTVRATLDGRYKDEKTGLVGGGSAFVDNALNNYAVDVEVTDARGRTSPARVRRFHDAYRAYGARLEGGIVDQPWARKLVLEGFASTYDKDLQNNVVMTVPYGEPRYGETAGGVTARYESPELAKGLTVEAVASYSRRAIRFTDDGQWVYDWFGRKVRRKTVGGEVSSAPTDQHTTEDGVFGRALVTWTLSPAQTVRVSATPSFTSRTGEDRALDPAVPDPFGQTRSLLTVTTGLEHTLDLLDDRLENVVFVKDYVYHATGSEQQTGTLFRERSNDDHGVGAGDALRFRFTPWLLAKASYEYAIRLPRADEVFGNGVLVLPNLGISPERSHNGNVGPRVELKKTPIGGVTLDVNGFLRRSENLIVLLGSTNTYRYENVYGARSVGAEGSLSWLSPGRWVSAEGMLTYQDIRNVSSEGSFGAYDGDRVPNRPYLFGSWGARVHIPHVILPGSSLEPFYHGRWVDSFYRAWESAGIREFKQVVASQLSHDVGVTWVLDTPRARTATTVEVDNATNARLFDFFGVQRPGRAIYLKISAQL